MLYTLLMKDSRLEFCKFKTNREALAYFNKELEEDCRTWKEMYEEVLPDYTAEACRDVESLWDVLLQMEPTVGELRRFVDTFGYGAEMLEKLCSEIKSILNSSGEDGGAVSSAKSLNFKVPFDEIRVINGYKFLEEDLK